MSSNTDAKQTVFFGSELDKFNNQSLHISSILPSEPTDTSTEIKSAIDSQQAVLKTDSQPTITTQETIVPDQKSTIIKDDQPDNANGLVAPINVQSAISTPLVVPSSESLSASSSERSDTFGTPTASTTVAATGDNNIDGLLIGRKWSSNSVTFSFTDSIDDYESGYPDRASHGASYQSLNATQRSVARSWIGSGGAYYNVSNLSFSELTGASDRDATIRMAMSNVPGTAFAYYPANTVQAGDAWFNTSDYNSPQVGNYAYHTFGHELGHALGLKHGHETGGVSGVAMNSDRDSMEFSIMTYRSYVGHDLTALPYYTNESGGYAQSLMMYDIRAIQQMYGAWFGSNSSNTTYTFSTTTGEMFINNGGVFGVGQGTPVANRVFRTVWDGNGIDTYDFSNYTTNLSVDLTPGGWSDLDVGGNFQRAKLNDGYGGITKYARGHLFNALQYNGDARSLIENANGGTGNDSMTGNGIGNVLNGNGGNDTINGGSGQDYMDGGAGTDTIDYRYWSGGGTYNLATGVASFPGFYDEQILNFENIYTGAGNDNIIGSGGNTLNAGDGNDTVRGGSGQDYMDGGAGTDTVDYRYWSGGGTYNLATGVASFPGFYDEQILNFENIYTGAGNDEIIGSAIDNMIDAGSGNDTVNGGTGNDLIYLGAGNDYVNTTALGNDTFFGGSGDDFVYGSASDELYYGEDGNDTLQGYYGNDLLDGGSGSDLLRGGVGNDIYVVDQAGDTVEETSVLATEVDTVRSYVNYTLGENLERLSLKGSSNINATGNSLNNLLVGNIGNNSLAGLAGDDTLNAGAGNDTLDGGIGTDLMVGGTGHDYYIVDNAGDMIQETSSVATEIDTVRSYISYSLGSNLERLSLQAVSNINAIGNNLSNLLVGNAGNNLLNGQFGNDILTGNAGNDVFVGAQGNDTLTGGGGNDSYHYVTGAAFSAAAVGIDHITDFGRVAGNKDNIMLSSTTFSSGTNFANVTTDALAAISGAHIAFSMSTGNLFYNQNGNAAGFGTGGQFATLSGIASMVASDFLIVT
jgi:serralysin